MADDKAEKTAVHARYWKRILPDWMVGAGKRVVVGQKKKATVVAVTAVAVEVPVKKVTARAAAPRSTTKTKAKC